MQKMSQNPGNWDPNRPTYQVWVQIFNQLLSTSEILVSFNSWKSEWELYDQNFCLKTVLLNPFDFVYNNRKNSVFLCWIKCQYLFHAQFYIYILLIVSNRIIVVIGCYN